MNTELKKELNISHFCMGWLDRSSFQLINLWVEDDFNECKCLKRDFLSCQKVPSKWSSNEFLVIRISFSSSSSICFSFESRWVGFLLATKLLKEFNLLIEWRREGVNHFWNLHLLAHICLGINRSHPSRMIAYSLSHVELTSQGVEQKEKS